MAKDHLLDRMGRVTFGQNVGSQMYADGNIVSGTAVVRNWYNESKTYNYQDPDEGGQENFTQLVWKSTTKVGFGCAKNVEKRTIYYAAHYEPCGNVTGQFLENVIKPNSRTNRARLLISVVKESGGSFLDLPDAVKSSQNSQKQKGDRDTTVPVNPTEKKKEGKQKELGFMCIPKKDRGGTSKSATH
ncbi:unnamed protein product [Calicophoron daubneyi]|uniref:SCP domain-containing protein n=1 Tax=Calicophoron daubneyi TaxID=300641 RepID=A0AAV2TDR9_CALDB